MEDGLRDTTITTPTVAVSPSTDAIITPPVLPLPEPPVSLLRVDLFQVLFVF